MKTFDMFCASQAATAICMSLEQHVVSSSTTIHLGSGRAIDRHNPIIDGSRRSVCSSKVTREAAASTCGTPRPQQTSKSARKSTSSSKPDQDENVYNNIHKKSNDHHQVAGRRSSSAASLLDAVRKSSCIRPADLVTPPGSRRYLLAENQSQDKLQQPHSDKILALVPAENKKITADSTASEKPVRSSSLKKTNNNTPFLVPSSDKCYSSFLRNSDQVVAFRVLLHCKGCAGKVKKNISRLQGVTSFNIDFDAKKVTVVGDITPLEVLASIAKVRTVQLLPPEKPNAALPVQTIDEEKRPVKILSGVQLK